MWFVCSDSVKFVEICIVAQHKTVSTISGLVILLVFDSFTKIFVSLFLCYWETY